MPRLASPRLASALAPRPLPAAAPSRRQVFSRPLGLAGVWGPMVREWLEEVLPADAADRCRGRVTVVMLRARNAWFPLLLERVKVADYASRAELIDAVMASVHLPLF